MRYQYPRQSRSKWLVLCVGLGLAACARSRPLPQLPVALDSPDLPVECRPYLADLHASGERNAVMNYECLAMEALFNPKLMPAQTRRQLVEHSLDEAIRRMDMIVTDTAEARKARSLWFKESSKDFKGEPYERAMAYFVRGWLLMAGGDFQNARACFKSGMLQDAVTEEDQNKGDFYSMDFSQALADWGAGDRDQGQTLLVAARDGRASLPAASQQANLRLLFLVGNGPTKLAMGEYQELLKINPGLSRPAGIFVYPLGKERASENAQDVAEIENVSFQAVTRGGRQVDLINKHKAVWKATAQQLGTGLMLAGGTVAATSNDNNTRDAGAIIALAGLAVWTAAAMMATQADTRVWSNLPDRICYWEAHVSEATRAVLLKFQDQAGEVLAYHLMPVTPAPQNGPPATYFLKVW